MDLLFSFWMMLVKCCILVLVFIKQVVKEVVVMIVFVVMVKLFFVGFEVKILGYLIKSYLMEVIIIFCFCFMKIFFTQLAACVIFINYSHPRLLIQLIIIYGLFQLLRQMVQNHSFMHNQYLQNFNPFQMFINEHHKVFGFFFA